MAFKILIEMDEDEMKVEDVLRTASYMGETLRVMGYSYSISCLKDGMKLTMKARELSQLPTAFTVRMYQCFPSAAIPVKLERCH